MTDIRKAHYESQLTAAAAALGETVERVDAERAARARTPLIHRYDSTTTALEAIDAGAVADGDVLVVESESVVGFLVVHFAVAITEATGAFRPYALLGKPGREYSDGAWARSVDVAEEAARQLDLPLGEPGGFQNGDRALCGDGRVRTVLKVKQPTSSQPEHANDPDVQTWVYMDDGTAHRLETCETVDRASIAKARVAARRAAARACQNPDPDDLEWRTALDELTEALTYLKKVDPAAAAELEEGSRGKRIRMEIPRTLVAPGDVLYELGARLEVRDTGVREAAPGGECEWWAQLHGVNSEDRQRTYREPWTVGLPLGQAAWDLVTVDRYIPCLPA
ncbi:hypothetical protein [Streptomyces sp. NPDC086782]|uniref:hypothetical protein n=1 Tax=Streptomyces sp. NPDC086782 TaxID=3365757 RepID=UPI0037FCD06D